MLLLSRRESPTADSHDSYRSASSDDRSFPCRNETSPFPLQKKPQGPYIDSAIDSQVPPPRDRKKLRKAVSEIRNIKHGPKYIQQYYKYNRTKSFNFFHSTGLQKKGGNRRVVLEETNELPLGMFQKCAGRARTREQNIETHASNNQSKQRISWFAKKNSACFFIAAISRYMHKKLHAYVNKIVYWR